MGEQFHEAVSLALVVIDDQQLLYSRSRVFLEAHQCRIQRFDGNRFGEAGESAAFQPMLPLFFHADDLDRNMARGRVFLQVVEHRPAQHVRQENVQADGRGLELARQRERRAAAAGDQALETSLARQAEQRARKVRVVLDDEQD